MLSSTDLQPLNIKSDEIEVILENLHQEAEQSGSLYPATTRKYKSLIAEWEQKLIQVTSHEDMIECGEARSAIDAWFS